MPQSSDHEAISTKVLSDLRQRVRSEQFETWFRGFTLTSLDEKTIEFEAASGFVRDWIARNFMTDLQQAIADVLGTERQVRIGIAPRTEVRMDTEPPPATSPSEDAAGSEAGIGDQVRQILDNVGQQSVGQQSVGQQSVGQQSVGQQKSTVPNTEQQHANGSPEGAAPLVEPTAILNQNYTFEQFVVGECNRLAHAVAAAIGANPGNAYNPFFVHGDVGLGKTHLLQGICHALKQMHPASKVIYLSCEEFTNRFMEANQNRAHEAFRAYYRSADILVIDDVEFLAHKSRTQVEFFHTFNTLYNAQKQIVLSSDRRATEIPTLEDRLVSRFRWGFEAEIHAPCLDTRIAIVKRKAFLRSVTLPDDVAEFIAETVATNIRELEGALIKVLGVATISNRPVELAVAREALDYARPRRSAKVSLDEIMQLVCTDYSVSAKEIVGKGRTQAISQPRQIGMYLARTHTDHSLEEVGRFFGNRDHTTVLYAVGKIKTCCERDRSFQQTLEDLGRRLLGL